MTRVIYLPDQHTMTIIDVPEPAASLAEALRNGLWPLPVPQPETTDFQVMLQAETVVVIVQPAPSASRKRLTPRQAQVLEGIMQGASIQQIALRLHISPRTVSYHASQVKQRLGADTLAQAVAQMVKSVG